MKVIQKVLYQELISTWVYENAGNDGNDPADGVEETQWKKLLKQNLKIDEILCKRDLYLHQATKIFREMGLSFQEDPLQKMKATDAILYEEIKSNINQKKYFLGGQLCLDLAFDDYFNELKSPLKFSFEPSAFSINNLQNCLGFFKESAEHQKEDIKTSLESLSKNPDLSDLELSIELTLRLQENVVYIIEVNWAMSEISKHRFFVGQKIIDSDE
jgi:hypothetical protein